MCATGITVRPAAAGRGGEGGQVSATGEWPTLPGRLPGDLVPGSAWRAAAGTGTESRFRSRPAEACHGCLPFSEGCGESSVLDNHGRVSSGLLRAVLVTLYTAFIYSATGTRAPSSVVVSRRKFVVLSALRRGRASSAALGTTSVVASSLSRHRCRAQLSRLRPVTTSSLSLSSARCEHRLHHRRQRCGQVGFGPSPGGDL